MKWRKIKGYKNYLLSDKGDLYNTKTDKILQGSTNSSGVRYVSLSKNGQKQAVQLAHLVLSVYKPSQTVIRTQAIHTDLELENCSNGNLERGTHGDRIRMFYRMKKKLRGVYPYPHGKKKWRAAFKNRQGKYVTVGYYHTEFFARFQYMKAYKKEFGMFPY